MAVILLARTAWPFPQLRALTVGSAIVFLALMGTALHRVWKVHQMAYSKALAGDQVLTQTLNATIWAYQNASPMKRKLWRMSRGRNASARGRERSSGHIY